MAASPFLTRTCVTDPMALDVLAALDHPVEPLEPLSRWKALEVLRVAALDLSGQIPLETVGRAAGRPGRRGARRRYPGPAAWTDELAVIDMGKLGARELNYGSDIDIVLVGGGDPQQLVALARQAWRIDLGLRPEGRSGPLVRSLCLLHRLLGPLGADLGVPGPAESQAGRRPPRAGRGVRRRGVPAGVGPAAGRRRARGPCGP